MARTALRATGPAPGPDLPPTGAPRQRAKRSSAGNQGRARSRAEGSQGDREEVAAAMSGAVAMSAAVDAPNPRSCVERSDVLVSAVISTYLLTHLHHVLQRAEYGAQKDGRQALAANYAQLRKVLCLDARTMEDASAVGQADQEPLQAA